MAITTYSELKTAVADWLNRSDLTSAIPNFISLAEAQMSRQIRHRKMVTRATATMDTPYFAVPSDWKETIRFQLNTNPITPLVYVTPEQLLEDSQVYSAGGQPMFFTTIGQQFEVLPQPDGSYDAELLYYAKLPALSDAALAQSAPYLKEDERTGIWTSLYEKLAEDMRIADERARIGSSKLKPRVRTFG
jgi:hypothetical protein